MADHPTLPQLQDICIDDIPDYVGGYRECRVLYQSKYGESKSRRIAPELAVFLQRIYDADGIPLPEKYEDDPSLMKRIRELQKGMKLVDRTKSGLIQVTEAALEGKYTFYPYE